jgi:hypothetical protein
MHERTDCDTGDQISENRRDAGGARERTQNARRNERDREVG